MKYLADSDFLVGLFSENDAHNSKSVDLMQKMVKRGNKLFVLNLVVQESATVLSHRVNMDAVRLFYEKLPRLNLNVVSVDDKAEVASWSLFLKQTKKGCSFVDCANLSIFYTHKFDGIVSFDRFYPSSVRFS